MSTLESVGLWDDIIIESELGCERELRPADGNPHSKPLPHVQPAGHKATEESEL